MCPFEICEVASGYFLYVALPLCTSAARLIIWYFWSGQRRSLLPANIAHETSRGVVGHGLCDTSQPTSCHGEAQPWPPSSFMAGYRAIHIIRSLKPWRRVRGTY